MFSVLTEYWDVISVARFPLASWTGSFSLYFDYKDISTNYWMPIKKGYVEIYSFYVFSQLWKVRITYKWHCYDVTPLRDAITREFPEAPCGKWMKVLLSLNLISQLANWSIYPRFWFFFRIRESNIHVSCRCWCSRLWLLGFICDLG